MTVVEALKETFIGRIPQISPENHIEPSDPVDEDTEEVIGEMDELEKILLTYIQHQRIFDSQLQDQLFDLVEAPETCNRDIKSTVKSCWAAADRANAAYGLMCCLMRDRLDIHGEDIAVRKGFKIVRPNKEERRRIAKENAYTTFEDESA